MALLGIVLLIIFIVLVIAAFVVVIVLARRTTSVTNQLGATCTTQLNCGSGFVCTPQASFNSICLGGLGTGCTGLDQCAAGLTCNNGTCITLPLSKPPPTSETITTSTPTPPDKASTVAVDTKAVPPAPKPKQTAISPVLVGAPRHSPAMTAVLGVKEPVRSVHSPMRSELGVHSPIFSARRVDLEINSPAFPVQMPASKSSNTPTVGTMFNLGVPAIHQPQTFDTMSNISSVKAVVDGKIVMRPSADLHDYSSPVMDACSFSDIEISLLVDGKFICTNKDSTRTTYRVTSNVHIIQIASCSDYLHGLANDGRIYKLQNDFLHMVNWQWQPISELNNLGYIDHINTTHDGKHLWIQCGMTGYMYHNNKQISSQSINGRRVHGRTPEIYVDLPLVTNSASLGVIQATKNGVTQAITGMRYAMYDYNDNIVTISVDSQYIRIVLVSWQPHYIRAH